MINFEYWGIDKNGDKFHDNISVKSRRSSKAKKLIEAKEKILISECKDFGVRQCF